MSEERIRSVEQDLARTDLTPRTRAALAFGRSQSRAGPAASREARAALGAAGIGRDEMREIAFAVASVDFLNRAFTMPAISAGAMERMPDWPGMRLLRPLIKRMMLGNRSRGQPTPPAAASDPYARLVEAFAGSPIAPALARTIEEMWASPLLT